MPVYYLEPSALVKYYVTEPGSTWVRWVVDAEANVLVSAEITMSLALLWQEQSKRTAAHALLALMCGWFTRL